MNTKKPVPKTSWKAPEFTYIEKSADWYWILWIIGILIAGLSVLASNIIFAVLIILSTLVLALLARRRPIIVPITLTPHKILIGNKSYKTDNFETYNIIPELSRIILHPKQHFRPLLIIPLAPGASIIQVNKVLGLSSIKYDENLSQSFLDLFFEQLGL